jgi:ABC-type spermidine/putrescine transport system permease subunit I
VRFPSLEFLTEVNQSEIRRLRIKQWLLLLLRTLAIALTVTVLCLILALPVAFYAAKVARPNVRRLLIVAFLVPLWASYLVKAYAWRVMLSNNTTTLWPHSSSVRI